MTRQLKFILMFAVLIGFLAGFIPSEKVQAYWLTDYVGEAYGSGTKWDRSGYNGHAYWYRQYSGPYVFSGSSWYSGYFNPVVYHYWSAYIPSALYTSKAVVSYNIKYWNYATVNQNSYNNTWAYVGATDGAYNQSFITLTNSCVTGYTCNGLEVIWDEAKYQWWVD